MHEIRFEFEIESEDIHEISGLQLVTSHEYVKKQEERIDTLMLLQ